MKLVIASLMLAMAPAASFAVSADFGGGYTTPGYEVEYLYSSWCNQNEVTSQDGFGELVLLQDCSEQGLTCKTKEAYRGRKVVVSAYCSAK
ncbi:hypothetical protein [Bdellovibrio sp. HCB2-146]|uniref:hypothetical protein n=1 Tax=Bdellovibrio sp. HCB2-146 TaxID=3394362 RepID=UPI0039BD5C57